ncbi:PfkB family carbohydrate kinase [Pasteurella sp. PK-2025]|uniref:PfkB family carbohydrate kinase n=1 Tax=Pasteurella sp. PK-2025 TaxID=3413133 RepID=UPI003C726433
MKILLIGAVIVDQMMWLDKLPQTGDDVLCKATKSVVGGCAFNVASMLTHLNVPHELCAPVGQGIYANIIKQALQQGGYPYQEDTSGDNGYCLCLIEQNGERTFITVEGVEGTFKREWLTHINANQYAYIYLVGYQMIGQSGHIILDWLTQSLHNPTTQIVFAPGAAINTIGESVLDRLFALKPIVHLNRKEILQYTHTTSLTEAISLLYAKNQNHIVVTLGSEGVAWHHHQQTAFIPTVPAQVVDTVGAGDSHIAALMAYLSKGEPWERALQQANRIASAIVSVEGATVNHKTFLKWSIDR